MTSHGMWGLFVGFYCLRSASSIKKYGRANPNVPAHITEVFLLLLEVFLHKLSFTMLWNGLPPSLSIIYINHSCSSVSQYEVWIQFIPLLNVTDVNWEANIQKFQTYSKRFGFLGHSSDIVQQLCTLDRKELKYCKTIPDSDIIHCSKGRDGEFILAQVIVRAGKNWGSCQKK